MWPWMIKGIILARPRMQQEVVSLRIRPGLWLYKVMGLCCHSSYKSFTIASGIAKGKGRAPLPSAKQSLWYKRLMRTWVAQGWERSPLITMILGWIPGPGIMCVELSLLVLSCASRVFLRVLGFSSLHKNQPLFDLGCALWPDMSCMAAARGTLVCLWLGHVELRLQWGD